MVVLGIIHVCAFYICIYYLLSLFLLQTEEVSVSVNDLQAMSASRHKTTWQTTIHDVMVVGLLPPPLILSIVLLIPVYVSCIAISYQRIATLNFVN